MSVPPCCPKYRRITQRFRTRRLIDLETHEAVFTWMLQRLADASLMKGTTVDIDATAGGECRAAQHRIVGVIVQDADEGDPTTAAKH